jgi:hypothetical protein
MLAAGAALSAGLCLPGQAQAWWRGGVFIGVPPVIVGPPVYYPPPVYAPPPVVYAPPPVVYAPPPPSYAPEGPRCYAGAYVCPLQGAVPPGGACSCYGNAGQLIPGRAGG